ncbi:Kinase A inhibitor [compost metagenome]
MDCSFFPLGDSAVLVEFSTVIDESVNRRVRAAAREIGRRPFSGFVECVPAYASLAVYYRPAELEASDPGVTYFEQVCALLRDRMKTADDGLEELQRVVEIPVCYGGEFGPDLSFVAEWNGLTEEEVISFHAEGRYQVYALGFAPGFPYMGGMSGKIAAPRRETPRLSIPAGSVGIAGNQTGVYPIETPGGWQIIGRTPLSLFRPGDMPPTLLQSGDTILFRPISPGEYASRRERSQ